MHAQWCNYTASPAGALVDVFSDYKPMYLLCGGVMLTSGLFLFIMNFYNYRLLEREQRALAAGA